MARNREWSWSIFSDMACFSVAHESSAWPHSLNDLNELIHQVGALLEGAHAKLLQELDICAGSASAHRDDHARITEMHAPQQHADLDPVDVGQIEVQEQKIRHPPSNGADRVTPVARRFDLRVGSRCAHVKREGRPHVGVVVDDEHREWTCGSFVAKTSSKCAKLPQGCFGALWALRGLGGHHLRDERAQPGGYVQIDARSAEDTSASLHEWASGV